MSRLAFFCLVILLLGSFPVVSAAIDYNQFKDPDGDCQKTRHEVLIRDSLVPVTFMDPSKRCRVKTGKWIDPYTGAVITDATKATVDHIVPKGHTQKLVGKYWSKKVYMFFKNDPENLVVVGPKINEKKGSRPPQEWRPPLKSYWCTYVQKWRYIKHKYQIPISAVEEASLQEMATTCP